VRLVADRLALSEGIVAATLGGGGGGGGGGRDRAGNGNGVAARRSLGHRDKVEHEFLALCRALEPAGRARLADPGTLDLLASPLTRRAAEHLRDHADSPAAALAPEDPDLGRLVAEIVLRARELDSPEPAALERAALHLDLARLDRDIAAARLDASPVSDLAAERQRVLGELRKLSH
jgi:hypothetical protein